MKPMNKQSLVMATATIITITGAYLNAFKDILCFPLWILSNLVFMAAALKDRNYWMSLVFFLYFTTSIIGIWSWLN